MRFLIILSLLLTSCASYVNSIHKKIDNENRGKRAQYQRYMNPQDRRPISNPVTLGGASANTRANLPPQTQRQYQSRGSKRYRAEDLKDNDGDGSLWSGQNSDSFLFIKNNMKRKGDIIIVDVYSQLKKQIQDELGRAYPEKAVKAKKGDTKDAPKEEKAAEVTKDSPDKVYDKISASVIEQVNQDYILIRGRKEIMYKKFKRYFEIQALVSQKDISANDTVASKKVLESKIKVLRY
jgi:flagellar basal body L-ring protein FlgH